MASGTGDADGAVTAATVAHYDRIVQPWQGLAFVEYTTVHPLGRSEANQTALYDDRHADGLRQIAALMRAKGVLPGIQLTLAGGKTEADLIGQSPVGADTLPIPAHGGELPAPAAASEALLAAWHDAFVKAALLAEAAGFAVIEVHGAHGYFINQWLSPVTNRRHDRHGGSLANRAAWVLELIRTLRAVLRPETVLSMRFAAQDRLDGGLTLAEGRWLAQQCEQAGIGLFNVSSGLGGWRRGREQRGEGYLVADAAVIREAVTAPVIGVGGIQTRAYAERIVAEACVDLVALGRATLASPTAPWQETGLQDRVCGVA
jgi:NADPH2 dehydrogenase